jgi:hypothetical protein
METKIPRYDFDLNRRTRQMELREKPNGRFMVADEVIALAAIQRDEGRIPVETLAYIAKLERIATETDGVRCDGCKLVFDEQNDDLHYGEDCLLCAICVGTPAEATR